MAIFSCAGEEALCRSYYSMWPEVSPSLMAVDRRRKSNGGQVVPLEKDADVWIADHLKPRDIPRGWYAVPCSL